MDVSAINEILAVALLDNGATVAITNWVADDGEDCEKADAVCAVAGPDEEGEWYAIDLRLFDAVSVN